MTNATLTNKQQQRLNPKTFGKDNRQSYLHRTFFSTARFQLQVCGTTHVKDLCFEPFEDECGRRYSYSEKRWFPIFANMSLNFHRDINHRTSTKVD